MTPPKKRSSFQAAPGLTLLYIHRLKQRHEASGETVSVAQASSSYAAIGGSAPYSVMLQAVCFLRGFTGFTPQKKHISNIKNVIVEHQQTF
jgi:hypothetical protein